MKGEAAPGSRRKENAVPENKGKENVNPASRREESADPKSRRKRNADPGSRHRRIGRVFGAFVCICLGVGLLAYPWLSNWLYDNQTYSEYNVYFAEVEDLKEEERMSILAEAREYNSLLPERQATMTNPFHVPTLMDLGDEVYGQLLCVDDSGVMGYLEIPAISVSLPIYHGTEDETLSAGIGHMEGSSLPVGGVSTHAVLTGHSGLTGKKLFTDLPELEEGDYFYIRILGEILAYRVTKIQTVLPEQMDTLRIEEGRDLVTLMTCTPYGVNSHRLLVTGERVEYVASQYEASTGEKTSTISARWLEDYRNAALTAFTLLAFLILAGKIAKIRKKRKNERK